MANYTDNEYNVIIPGLRADIMRCSMENKNLLSVKGSIYVGTGENNDLGGDVSVPKTEALTPGNQGYPLVSKGNNGVAYEKLESANINWSTPLDSNNIDWSEHKLNSSDINWDSSVNSSDINWNEPLDSANIDWTNQKLNSSDINWDESLDSANIDWSNQKLNSSDINWDESLDSSNIDWSDNKLSSNDITWDTPLSSDNINLNISSVNSLESGHLYYAVIDGIVTPAFCASIQTVGNIYITTDTGYYVIILTNVSDTLTVTVEDNQGNTPTSINFYKVI